MLVNNPGAATGLACRGDRARCTIPEEKR